MSDSLLSDPEVVRFLAKRLLGRAGFSGLSSNAMIAVAVLRENGLPDEYDGPIPHDLGDLGRCCETFALAPRQLRERMLPILARWAGDLSQRAESSAGRGR